MLSRRLFLQLTSAGLVYVANPLRGNAQLAEPAAAPEEPAVDSLPFVPGSWTIAVLPDTQHYTQGKWGHHFDNQTRWIAKNAKTHNIAYTLHLGDIVNNNKRTQWRVARKAMQTLDGVVPYAFVTGNHDYGANGKCETRETFLNAYFPFSRYKDWPTLGGVMEAGRMENSYHLFSAGGRDWIVVALEFGPRHETVAWADKILAEHPNRLGILITHAYMYYDDTRYDRQGRPNQRWSPHTLAVAKEPSVQTFQHGDDIERPCVAGWPRTFVQRWCWRQYRASDAGELPDEEGRRRRLPAFAGVLAGWQDGASQSVFAFDWTIQNGPAKSICVGPDNHRGAPACLKRLNRIRLGSVLGSMSIEQTGPPSVLGRRARLFNPLKTGNSDYGGLRDGIAATGPVACQLI